MCGQSRMRGIALSVPAIRLSPLGRQVLSRYHSASLATRLFLSARWRWTPYEQIADRVPRAGTILDLGSGHGLLSLALALSEPARRIRGIDHDPGRVALARQAAVGLTNLEFATGSLLEAVNKESLRGTVAGIVVMDAMHYLSYDEQAHFLAQARNALQPAGILLIRDVDADAGKNFFLNRLHERAMTGLGFTRADQLHFRTGRAWLQLFASAGFEPASEPCSRFPFADRLFTCKLPAADMARAA
jgi:SAM-dependent methyltransferase